MNANVELVADRLIHLARPGGVVLVDRQFFGPLIEALRARPDHMHLSIRTAHFEDPVSLLKQALIIPRPEIACCPDGATGEQCECLRKAHMLLDQLGIPVIETHSVLVAIIPSASEPHLNGPPPTPTPRESVAA